MKTHHRIILSVSAFIVTALLAVVWGVGVMGASGIPMDAFNASTPILILAVAAGHAVQILKRYYEEYHHLRAVGSQLTPKEANKNAVIESDTSRNKFACTGPWPACVSKPSWVT